MRTTRIAIRALRRAWTAIRNGRALDVAWRRYLADADQVDQVEHTDQAGVYPKSGRGIVHTTITEWRLIVVLAFWCYVALC